MKVDAKTVKTLKRIFGIAIPTLVLLITLITVSVSFAWFSSDIKPSVQSIDLTVASVFTLSFDTAGTSSERNINYKGQTAIDLNGRLVNNYNSNKHPIGNVEPVQYLLDMPYYFITTIELGTENQQVSMKMLLDIAEITKNNEDGSSSILKSYASNADAIPYAFTWYFKKHVENSTNFTVNSDNKQLMKDNTPSEGEVWYTPYGTLKFGANGTVADVNGNKVESLIENGLQEILLNAGGENENQKTLYDFHIVFAPEELYWAQFSPDERDMERTVREMYDNDELKLKEIFGESSINQMYYSNTAYYGSTFTFGATIQVSSVGGQPI